MEPITGQIVLKRGREKPVFNRHPWIFSGAIAQTQGDVTPGGLVQVVDRNGRFLATAYFNPHSQIRARILSWDPQESIDRAFWQRRLQRALDARQALQLPPTTSAYRLVNAEADGIPGLIVDQYAQFLVVQALTLGIEARKEQIFALLAEMLQPRGIVERSDLDVRAKEGLESTGGVRWGAPPPAPLTITENGHAFAVDLLGGHKTGFYLDQRDNRALLAKPTLVAGKTVLNLFAYTGAFAVYAASGGAEAITNVDSSYEALQLAEHNLALNDYARPQDEYIAGDAFELLRFFRDTERQFDVVIIDPPKFAHSRSDVDRACRGYKDLNWLALRLLRPGGVLATFSCSGLVSADLFQKVVFSASVDAQRDAQILHVLGQAPDHPILLTFPESAYLKGLLCRVW